VGDESSPQKPPAQSCWTWTSSQRRVLIAILVGLFVYLSIRYACNPVYVSDPQPEVPARFDDLADRIDPNTADWETLAALPGIGEKRAKDIIAYRERAAAERPGKPVFEKPTDLLRIRGIGRAMMEGMEPYLTFPSATVPATQP
jgi:hypothetical protein